MIDARPWTHAALFGALWGALELSLGTILQLSRLPLRGSIMAICGLACMFTLRRLQPQVGVCALAGFVAVILKVFTLGGFFPGPVIGIALEVLMVEVAFLIFRHKKLAAAMAGAGALATHPIQMVLMTTLMAGPEVVSAMVNSLVTSIETLGLGSPSIHFLALLVICFFLITGSFVGLWTWGLAIRVAQRVGTS